MNKNFTVLVLFPLGFLRNHYFAESKNVKTKRISEATKSNKCSLDTEVAITEYLIHRPPIGYKGQSWNRVTDFWESIPTCCLKQRKPTRRMHLNYFERLGFKWEQLSYVLVNSHFKECMTYLPTEMPCKMVKLELCQLEQLTKEPQLKSFLVEFVFLRWYCCFGFCFFGVDLNSLSQDREQ